jgi:hypothetical protein
MLERPGRVIPRDATEPWNTTGVVDWRGTERDRWLGDCQRACRRGCGEGGWATPASSCLRGRQRRALRSPSGPARC